MVARGDKISDRYGTVASALALAIVTITGCAFALTGNALAAERAGGNPAASSGSDGGMAGSGSPGGSGNIMGPGAPRNVTDRSGNVGGAGTGRSPGSPATSPYRGGRSMPENEGNEPAPAASVAGIAPGSPGWCDGARVGTLEIHERISGRNLERLNSARMSISPQAAKRLPRVQEAYTYTLAVYQREITAPDPDLRLGGLFLGSIAQVPVTPEVVQRVNNILCARLPAESVRRVSDNAEVQRRSLAEQRQQATR